MALTEFKRLETLLSSQIMDSPQDDAFCDLTEFASTMCGTPIALVSLVDGTRQWFKSRVGLEATETPKKIAFCDHAIKSGKDLFVVTDARVDPRFKNNPLVTEDPHLVFYAGAPLVTEDGFKLGTLCVIDHQPRVLSADKSRLLVLLARQVSQLIALRQNKVERDARTMEMERLIDRLPSGLHKWALGDDGELRFEGCNAAAKALFGTDHSMYVGKTYEQVLPTFGVKVFSEKSLNVAQNGGSIQYETPYQSSDGTVGTLSAVHFQGAPGTMISIFKDVSMARSKERELAETHRMLQLMTDGSADAFWHRPDPRRSALKWSDRIKDLLGYEVDSKELSADGFVKLLHPDDRDEIEPVMSAAIVAGDTFDIECRILDASDVYRWFRIRGARYYDSNGGLNEMAGSISPIEKMIELQHDLQMSNQKLEQFAYQISHDLKAPLVSARRMCQVILEDINMADYAEARVNVDVMSSQMTVLENLVSGLLSFIYAESGEIKREPVCLTLVVEQIRTFLLDWMETESVALTHSIDVEDSLMLEPIRVRQILQNLIVNGIKYRSKKRTDCLVHVNMTQCLNGVSIEVIDNGRGIPESHHSSVFNTFTRFHSDTIGSGLGLAIVKQHVEAMSGTIGFTSNKLGTKFDIFIPVVD